MAFCPFAGRKLPKNRLSGVPAPPHSYATLRNGSTAPPILATSPPFAKRLEIVKAWLRQTSFSRPRIIAENAVVSKDYIVCASRLEILKAWSRRIFDSYDHEQLRKVQLFPKYYIDCASNPDIVNAWSRQTSFFSTTNNCVKCSWFKRLYCLRQ